MEKISTDIANRKTLLILCLITSAAFLLRIKYMEQTEIINPFIADAREYVQYGYNLAFKHTYSSSSSPEPLPDSFRSPGYPMLMALAFLVGDTAYFYPVILLWQTLLSTLLVPLTFLVGIHMFSHRWALTAAALTAFSPHLVTSSGYLLTETLFCFLLLISLFCFIQGMHKNNSHWAIVSGGLTGLAYLTNETALLIPCIWVGVSIAGTKKKTRPRQHLFIFLLVFAIFPLGWTIRNVCTLSSGAKAGKDRLIGSMSHGAYPGFFHKTEAFRYFPYREDPRQGEFGGSLRGFATILQERAQKEPMKYLSWYLLEKPRILWSWSILQGQGDVYIYPVKTSLYQKSPVAEFTRKAMETAHPFFIWICAGGLLGFITRLIRGDRSGLPAEGILFALIVYYTAIHTITAPWPRYAIPLRPEIYLFSIQTIVYWSACIKRIKNPGY